MKKLMNAILTLLFVSPLGVSITPTAGGAEQLYNNTHLSIPEGERLANPPPLELLAQPFRTDAHNTTITGVSVSLGVIGSPSGDMPISIWDDQGGLPGKQIAVVGVVSNVASLPVINLDVAPTVLEPQAWDVTIPGLEPDSTYYVVLDHKNLITTPPFGDNLIVGGLRTTEGTSNAGALLALAPSDPNFGADWFDLSVPLGDARHLSMSVTAVPEPAVRNLLALVLVGLLIACRSRVRQRSTSN